MSTASSGQKVTDSLNGKLTFEQDKNRIVGRDENNLPRLLILADGTDFVMKVSKAGFDVLTATGDELIFNSDQNIPKIIKTGTIATNSVAPSTFGTTTVSHGLNLNFTPIVSGYLVLGIGGSSSRPLPTYAGARIDTSGSLGSVAFVSWFEIEATSTDIIIHTTNADPIVTLGSYNIRYYLFQESAN